jgi:hypothetical protein
MNRRILFLMFVLVSITLACVQTPSTPSGGGGDNALDDEAVAPAAKDTATPAVTEAKAPKNFLRVIYAKGGNIWLWDDIAASPKQLTKSGLDSSPKVSDDGSVIAFLRNGELWAVNDNGDNERALASFRALAGLPHTGDAKSVEPRQFDFAPGGHDVYFNISLVGDSATTSEYNLVKVNADFLSLQSLLDGNQGGGRFVFSPDGKKIALPRNDGINVVNADGSNLITAFIFPLVLLNTEVNYIPQVVWMPDGSGFKTVIPPRDGISDRSAPARFYYIFADGGEPAQLAEFIAVPAIESQPSISPDGSKVLYAKMQGSDLELHVIDASTADQMYFSYAADRFGILGWTPDSKQVIYWIDDRRCPWSSSPNSPAVPLSDVTFADQVTWVNAGRFLFLNESELRIRVFDQPSILIDKDVTGGFDFSAVTR